MALGVRYRGATLSRAGVHWRVDILQEGYGGTPPAELSFPSEEPLIIEWAETDKLDPVQSSSATLKVMSDTDRQFIDLYTVEVGAVCMDVYRNGSLYWSGSLDTELYKEPYSMTSGYEVTLMFSDFACLGRLDWASTGLLSFHDIIVTCLQRACINYGSLRKMISTAKDEYSSPLTLQELFANQENFIDEEGEPSTARDVLEAILQPFALRIVQKAGNIFIYDLNALYSQAASRLEWGDSDDAVLGVDKIYNNVKVTFSPYGDAEMMKGEVEEDATLTADSGGRLFKMSYERDGFGQLVQADGFRLHLRETMKSNMTIAGGAKYFQIRSIYSGDDHTGVAMSVRAGDYVCDKEGQINPLTTQLLNNPKDCGTIAGGNINTDTVITCPRVFLGYVSIRRFHYKLRLDLELLFDTRYNPFESEGDYNDNAAWRDGFLNLGHHDGAYQNMQDWCNFGYVPIRLSLVDEDGTVMYHYENAHVLESSGYKHDYCRWVSGEGRWGQCWLCYYDFEDRKSKTGFGGWAKNKQIIGYYRDELPAQWNTIGKGEFIDLPPVGGYLVLEIGAGVHQFDWKREVKNIYRVTRWVAYKNPGITLCRTNCTEVEAEDIEDSAWLNRAAKEELEIDTIIGTITQKFGLPNAKGQVFAADRSVYSTFHRAGVTDRLERLLIGTVYSQYADRHATLSGTARLLPSFGIYTERATAGKFMVLSEMQDIKSDTSEVTLSELTEEEYQGIEYEE